LFESSAPIFIQLRTSLERQEHSSMLFWVGFLLITSVILAVLSLISTLTAWAMLVRLVEEKNAYCILHSGLGQYATELPGRLALSAVLSFFVWASLLSIFLLPFGTYSGALICFALGVFGHQFVTFTSFGRLLTQSAYPIKKKTLVREDSLNGKETNETCGTAAKLQCGKDRIVKFVDGFDTSGHRVQINRRSSLKKRTTQIVRNSSALSSLRTIPTPNNLDHENASRNASNVECCLIESLDGSADGLVPETDNSFDIETGLLDSPTSHRQEPLRRSEEDGQSEVGHTVVDDDEAMQWLARSTITIHSKLD